VTRAAVAATVLIACANAIATRPARAEGVHAMPDQASNREREEADATVLAATLRHLVRYGLGKAKVDRTPFDLDGAKFVGPALRDQLAAQGHGVGGLVAEAQAAPVDIVFAWTKADGTRAQAGFVLTRKPVGLEVSLRWVDAPERIPLHPREKPTPTRKPLEENVQETLAVGPDGRLASFAPPGGP
jgi:hypothetical protein